jgi:hypothetical protein
MNQHHAGCCGCHSMDMVRRTFFATLGGAALGTALAARAGEAPQNAPLERMAPTVAKRDLVVQPILLYQLFDRQEARSWRPWGGLKTPEDVDAECARIAGELDQMRAAAEFPLQILPLARVRENADAEKVNATPSDAYIIYAASGDGQPFDTLLKAGRHNIAFVRHRTGPAYLWYEIMHPRMLRKTVDEYGEPNLATDDVVVDEPLEVLWRLRALYALKNTRNARIVAIGGPSGWGDGGQQAPQLARDQWGLEIVDVNYDDLGKRIAALRADPAGMARYQGAAADYLNLPKTALETKTDFVTGAFLLHDLFNQLMAEAGASAITVNECMSTIIPMAQTTACLTLTLINDAGMLAFCESDFVVIPSGILLHHIASVPVFLQDPTYPHHGLVTLAHCTAPRRMDGKNLEPARIQTHFESDYGAAPRVDMRIGQTVTVLDPDFASNRWLGFRGTIQDNPNLDICRSQIDVRIDGDCGTLAGEMRGFHWMLAYGDHLAETGYALWKNKIGWLNLSSPRTSVA